MSNCLTESAIEEFAIKLFERLGCCYVYAPDIAPMVSSRNAAIMARCFWPGGWHRR